MSGNQRDGELTTPATPSPPPRSPCPTVAQLNITFIKSLTRKKAGSRRPPSLSVMWKASPRANLGNHLSTDSPAPVPHSTSSCSHTLSFLPPECEKSADNSSKSLFIGFVLFVSLSSAANESFSQTYELYMLCWVDIAWLLYSKRSDFSLFLIFLSFFSNLHLASLSNVCHVCLALCSVSIANLNTVVSPHSTASTLQHYYSENAVFSWLVYKYLNSILNKLVQSKEHSL